MSRQDLVAALLGFASGLVLAYAFGIFHVPNAWSWTIGAVLAVAVVLPLIEWNSSFPQVHVIEAANGRCQCGMLVPEAEWTAHVLRREP